jgi:hypothetical protein
MKHWGSGMTAPTEPETATDGARVLRAGERVVGIALSATTGILDVTKWQVVHGCRTCRSCSILIADGDSFAATLDRLHCCRLDLLIKGVYTPAFCSQRDGIV